MRSEQKSRPGIIAIILVGIVVCYAAVWPYPAYDIGRWLVPWFDIFLDQGRIQAFADPFGNYTPPYLYLLSFTTLFTGLLSKITLIKLLSVVSVGVLILSIRHLLKTLHAPRPTEGAIWVCLLPTAVCNAPLLGQCDGFWTAAAVMAIAEAVKRRAVPMLIWCGVAISFKAQAVFFAPLIVGLLINRKIPFALWPIPVAVYAAMMVPAWLVGWPALDLATVYVRQFQWGGEFIGNAANPWTLVNTPRAMGYFWIGYVAAIVATTGMIVAFSRRRLATRDLLEAAILSSAVLPFLLPKMHERFFFLADILSFALAWLVRDRSSVVLAMTIQISSMMAVWAYLVKSWAFVQIGAGLMLVAIIMVCVRLFWPSQAALNGAEGAKSIGRR